MFIVRNIRDGKRAASITSSRKDINGKWRYRPLAIHVFLTFKEANDLKKRFNSFTPGKPWVVRPVELKELD